VGAVLPKPLIGFFTFVIFSAVLSAYNAILHSAATMFCLDIYKPLFKPDIDEASLIRIGKVVIAIIALVSMTVAPFVAYAPDGLYQFMRRSTGFYNIPMIALMLTGFLTTRTSGFAARIAVGFYLCAYILLVFILKVPIHFIHVMGILFACMVALILLISRFRPRETPYVMRLNRAVVDLTPWKWGPYLAIGAMGLLVFVYLLCSPIGLAAPEGIGTKFAVSVSCLGVAVAVAIGWRVSRNRQSKARTE
jgi:SSS family solute:Na+ symporter